MTNEEVRKAIEKYQTEHKPFSASMMDVTMISSKEGADIISQTIEKISKKVEEDTELWCICEMAKMYMQGVKPVYPARPQGKWIDLYPLTYECSICRGDALDVNEYPYKSNFCPHCGADMRVSNTNGVDNI